MCIRRKMTRQQTKIGAQKRVDQIRIFRDELSVVLKDGVVSLPSEQLAALDEYHEKILDGAAEYFDVDTDQREKQLSLGMRVASFLGALGFGASLFFLFYQYWGFIGIETQVTILIFAPLFFLGLTYYAAVKDRSGYFSRIAGLVAVAAFVLNLVMIGQIFNITPSSNAFLIWALFGLLLAYATDGRLLLGCAILCLGGYLSAKVGVWSGCYWIHFGQRPENFFPAALLLFLGGCCSIGGRQDFNALYRVFGLLFFFLPVLVLANWGRISYLNVDQSHIEIGYQLVGFLGGALCVLLGVKKHWNDVVTCGNVFLVIFLYTKMFDWWWDWMPKYLFFLIVGLASMFFLLLFKRLRRSRGAGGR